MDTCKALDDDSSSSKMPWLKSCMLPAASFSVILISNHNPVDTIGLCSEETTSLGIYVAPCADVPWLVTSRTRIAWRDEPKNFCKCECDVASLADALLARHAIFPLVGRKDCVTSAREAKCDVTFTVDTVAWFSPDWLNNNNAVF